MNIESNDYSTSGRAGTDRIQAGWSAYGRDGEKIGDIEEVGPDYVLVTKGLIFPTDLFIPASAVEQIDPSEGRVYLTVDKSAVEDQNWVAPPMSGYDETAAPESEGPVEGLGYTGRETDFDAEREGRRAEDVGGILTGAGTATTGTGYDRGDEWSESPTRDRPADLDDDAEDIRTAERREDRDTF